MTASADNLRYERKFLPQGHSLAEVLAMVRRHPAAFREVYPPRTVNNVYLDSPGLHDYHNHVHGIACRSKSRIRWYGALKGRVAAPVFENKFKRGWVSGKSSAPLPEIALNGNLNGSFMRGLTQSTAVPDWLQLRLRHLQPSLVNRYRRHYFQSADGQFRLTVDSSLRFHHPAETEDSKARGAAREFDVVIELKFSPEHESHAEAVTNGFSIRMARCSKYVLGIERVHQS